MTIICRLICAFTLILSFLLGKTISSVKFLTQDQVYTSTNCTSANCAGANCTNTNYASAGYAGTSCTDAISIDIL